MYLADKKNEILNLEELLMAHQRKLNMLLLVLYLIVWGFEQVVRGITRDSETIVVVARVNVICTIHDNTHSVIESDNIHRICDQLGTCLYSWLSSEQLFKSHLSFVWWNNCLINLFESITHICDTNHHQNILTMMKEQKNTVSTVCTI